VSEAVDSHLHWNDLPLARRFNFFVLDVTAKAPLVISESFGYLLVFNVKLSDVPCENVVSGIILFINIMLSPFASPLKYPVSKEADSADPSSLLPDS
jgi:hypothetical protein